MIQVASFHLMLFTDYIPEPNQQYEYGWYLIYALGFQVAINMYYIIRSIVRLIRLCLIYGYNMYFYYRAKAEKLLEEKMGINIGKTQEEKDLEAYEKAVAEGARPVEDVNIIKLTLAENEHLRKN